VVYRKLGGLKCDRLTAFSIFLVLPTKNLHHPSSLVAKPLPFRAIHPLFLPSAKFRGKIDSDNDSSIRKTLLFSQPKAFWEVVHSLAPGHDYHIDLYR